MERREFIVLIGLSAAWSAAAQAQQRPTLGLLSSSEIPDWAIKPFRAGLEEGGYIEGRNDRYLSFGREPTRPATGAGG
jgi:putative tryptophan/tyrosine transport system substrate-binding protein